MKLYVDKMPQFHKARPVPYVIKDKIEDELQRLREDGIIEPVTFSKWAVPIVPVRKGTGVRICGDYKVIVNQAIIEDKYPLPRVEDLYASLAWGSTFSKLDLSLAYMQLILDVESREYVTINTHTKGYSDTHVYHLACRWRHLCFNGHLRVCWQAFQTCVYSWTTFW